MRFVDLPDSPFPMSFISIFCWCLGSGLDSQVLGLFQRLGNKGSHRFAKNQNKFVGSKALIQIIKEYTVSAGGPHAWETQEFLFMGIREEAGY